jgi:peptide/nickel transport system ATP-binding protein
MSTPPHKALLEIRDLSLYMPNRGKPCPVVSHVDITLAAGEVTCLVGESGCGKSLTARAVLGLLPTGFNATGGIFFDGQPLLNLPEKAWQQVRGKEIGMIFQEPMTALNPVIPVGEQVAEMLRLHLHMTRNAAQQQVLELFSQVGIPEAASRYHVYPHQLSGGMRQRVMIAMALACRPRLLLADEPTTALDVTIQNQILRLLQEQSQKRTMGLLLITHDLGVVAHMAHHVNIMYAGRLVETASTAALFAAPRHPYTAGLIACAPSLAHKGLSRLPVIQGTVPPPASIGAGCVFYNRCTRAVKQCQQSMPPLCGTEHKVACWNALP